jgi:hypothetical protein
MSLPDYKTWRASYCIPCLPSRQVGQDFPLPGLREAKYGILSDDGRRHLPVCRSSPELDNGSRRLAQIYWSGVLTV